MGLIRQNPKNNTWQYRCGPSGIWRGNSQTQEEAQVALIAAQQKLEEGLARIKRTSIERDAEHLNAVIRRARELDPELWNWAIGCPKSDT